MFVNHPKKSRATAELGEVEGARWDSDSHIDRLLLGSVVNFAFLVVFAAALFTSITTINQINDADVTTSHILVTDVRNLHGF